MSHNKNTPEDGKPKPKTTRLTRNLTRGLMAAGVVYGGIEVVEQRDAEMRDLATISNNAKPISSAQPLKETLAQRLTGLKNKGYDAFFIADYSHETDAVLKTVDKVLRIDELRIHDIFYEGTAKAQNPKAGNDKVVEEMWGTRETANAIERGLVKDKGVTFHPADTYLGPDHWAADVIANLKSPAASTWDKQMAMTRVILNPKPLMAAFGRDALFRSNYMAKILEEKAPEILEHGEPHYSVAFVAGGNHIKGRGHVTDQLREKGATLKIATIHVLPVKDKKRANQIFLMDGKENEVIVTAHAPERGFDIVGNKLMCSTGEIFTFSTEKAAPLTPPPVVRPGR